MKNLNLFIVLFLLVVGFNTLHAKLDKVLLLLEMCYESVPADRGHITMEQIKRGDFN